MGSWGEQVSWAGAVAINQVIDELRERPREQPREQTRKPLAVTTRENEALYRCPYCVQWAWECDHAQLSYFEPEQILESGPLVADVRRAGALVVELFAACRRQRRVPIDLGRIARTFNARCPSRCASSSSRKADP